ncbi:hypothetical protein F8M41_014681 [Gigaspora margarita]|uniref:Uncharacterized protein n=1 Tax=Gigaspora margarita TaxID=4874 RepID=A0A8H4ARB9_GIGMA|nr:hypothetical protein F8M41_014681 [Gigaspora margarita]
MSINSGNKKAKAKYYDNSTNDTIVFDRRKVVESCERRDKNQLLINNQKLAQMGHAREKIEHGYSYQNEPGIKKGDEFKSCTRGESREIKVGNKKPIEECKSLKANCIAWKMKIELFKAQTNSIKSKMESPERKEDNHKRERVCEESLDDLYKTWILKVENIRHAELEKQMPQKSDIADEISSTNKRHKGNNIVVEIVIRPWKKED